MLEKIIEGISANNDVRARLPKTLWSPLLHSPTASGQVCKGAHGIFCTFL